MLVKIEEATRRLGVSRETILKRLRSGEWPYHRLGEKAIRLDVDEIIQLTRVKGARRASAEAS
jgi:excisionase family DNA binding protein